MLNLKRSSSIPTHAQRKVKLTLEMASPHVKESAEDALRRLRDDVEAFRSPSVRDFLNSGNNAAPGAPTPRTRAWLEAHLIKLRTELCDWRKRSEDLETQLSVSTKDLNEQTERAEELETQLAATTRELNAERDALTRRIKDVEREHIAAASAAAQSSALLRTASETSAQQRAQLETDLDEARAQLAAALADRDAARGEAAAVRAEANHVENAAKTDFDALRGRVEVLESENNALRIARDKAVVDAADIAVNAGRAADATAADVAELRAESAARGVQARKLRAELATSAIELQNAQSAVRRAMNDVAECARLRRRVDELVQCERDARSATELIVALKEERDTLASLIGSLAPSGLPKDGMAVVATHHGERKVAVTEVSATEIEALQERLETYATMLSEAKREACAAGVARDAAVVDAERNRRMRKIVEVERKLLRSALSDGQTNKYGNTATEKRVEAAEAAESEYKRMVDELAKKLKERNAHMAAVVADKSPVETITRDMATVLAMQLRNVERERDDALEKVKELSKKNGEDNKRKKRTNDNRNESRKRSKKSAKSK